jgi:hypothetical protein
MLICSKVTVPLFPQLTALSSLLSALFPLPSSPDPLFSLSLSAYTQELRVQGSAALEGSNSSPVPAASSAPIPAAPTTIPGFSYHHIATQDILAEHAKHPGALFQAARLTAFSLSSHCLLTVFSLSSYSLFTVFLQYFYCLLTVFLLSFYCL